MNADNTDSCLETCKSASCGDGYIWAGQEECDDQNNNNNDACHNCTQATCGDGIINLSGDGEELEQCEPRFEDDLLCSNDCEKTGLIVFVSKETYDGNYIFGNLEESDADCTSLALAAFENENLHSGGFYNDDENGLQRWPFKAWLSNATDSPSTRFPSLTVGAYSTLSYILPSDDLIASDKATLLLDVDDTLTNPLNVNQTNQPLPDASVWTHTDPWGETFGMPCSDAQMKALYGRTNLTDGDWTNLSQADCGQKYHIYCFEQPPEQ